MSQQQEMVEAIVRDCKEQFMNSNLFSGLQSTTKERVGEIFDLTAKIMVTETVVLSETKEFTDEEAEIEGGDRMKTVISQLTTPEEGFIAASVVSILVDALV